MPKKFKGENSKAAVARARKADARAEEEAKKQKALEDEYWKDDDKFVQRKQDRKADKEKRRQEELARKSAARKALEEEEESLAKTSAKNPSSKLTRTQIQQQLERQQQEQATVNRSLSHDEVPLEENPNRLLEGEVEARSVEDAIAVLSVREPKLEKHPEKRIKAAYAKYEEENLPKLKAENPNMRLSQLKQMLKKDWMKSPENPMNQQSQAYNVKR
ncbi:coiled-coil domain-containing protein 124-like [Glandiceps talaboti]